MLTYDQVLLKQTKLCLKTNLNSFFDNSCEPGYCMVVEKCANLEPKWLFKNQKIEYIFNFQ
jgi:hypothetical protein